MAQQQIYLGAAPNDGQGTPIREAFGFCNSNFTELYNRVQATPPSSPSGAQGDVAGMYAFDTTYFYVCIADYDDTTEIWRRIAFDQTPW
jgi:hypothetical protein